MPATPPAVMTVPIGPDCQPRCCRKTPRNGPMPACMSAMKKLRAASAPVARLRSALPSVVGVVIVPAVVAIAASRSNGPNTATL
ncbi:hypothetical protein WR25_16208 [Diploscapter pachys]|uniref:Uncharacterized protein n=1 Tax=Diploscapter pachys TaxID=2018661 RepID=A0A2A2JWQ4_9BILA|nr:hypothetical protein WR25_16208 [Diploscapter pachys]